MISLKMVLEQIYPSKWLERRTAFGFIMGASYAVLGIASALMLFPQDPGLASVAFTSLLLLPGLNRMLSIEERQAARDKFSILQPFRDHLDIFKVYAFIFLGVLLVFSFFAIALPSSFSESKLFVEQVRYIRVTGDAMGDSPFFGILSNNTVVFLFCLFASFIYGAGSIFILIWNASVWGVVFGIIAKDAAAYTQQNPFAYFALTFVAVLPHMLAEASSYFLAAISGGVISKGVIREKFGSEAFNKIIKDALVIFCFAILVLVLAAYVETYLAPLFVAALRP